MIDLPIDLDNPKYINISQPKIRANKKDGGRRKVVVVNYKGSTYNGVEAYIDGASEIIYDPDKQYGLSSVFIRTFFQVVISETMDEVNSK